MVINCILKYRSSKKKKNLLFPFMCTWVPVSVSVCHIGAGGLELRGEHCLAWGWSYRRLWSTQHGGCKPNSGPLQEQRAIKHWAISSAPFRQTLFFPSRSPESSSPGPQGSCPTLGTSHRLSCCSCYCQTCCPTWRKFQITVYRGRKSSLTRLLGSWTAIQKGDRTCPKLTQQADHTWQPCCPLPGPIQSFLPP